MRGIRGGIDRTAFSSRCSICGWAAHASHPGRRPCFIAVENGTPPAETTDPAGVRVVLEDHVWAQKIVRDHPEVGAHRADALRAVSVPDHVAQDPSSADRRRFYLRGAGPSRWLLVVVSYEQTPARIISVFANRKDPKTWSA